MLHSSSKYLLVFIYLVRWAHGWVLLHRSPFRCYASPWRTVLYSSSDDNEDAFFDDFDGQIVGGGDNNGPSLPSSALYSRIQTIQQQEWQKDARTIRNWTTGNWHVRGFSLDFSTETTISSIIPAADSENCIWVGRTNGSVLKVQLGNEYWAQFRPDSSLSDKEQRQNDSDPETSNGPFLIRHHFATGNDNGQVTHLLEYDETYLFTVTKTPASSNLQQWLLHDDDDRPPTRCKTMEGAHHAEIVAAKVVPQTTVLFSAARDGSMALWNVETGDLLYQCFVDATIVCADSDGHVIYVGTADGRVVAYQLKDLLNLPSTGRDTGPVMPNGQWLASDNGAVTSIACGGPGTLGRGRDQPTYSLLTGDENGLVKQWEILPRKLDDITRLEQWPKLSTQRLVKKAHLFRGHHGAVSSLMAIDAIKFISSGVDCTVRAWNPVSGKEFLRMDGFDNPVKSLFFLGELLITDGMKTLVCVHDFGVNLEEESDDADFYLDNL